MDKVFQEAKFRVLCGCFFYLGVPTKSVCVFRWWHPAIRQRCGEPCALNRANSTLEHRTAAGTWCVLSLLWAVEGESRALPSAACDFTRFQLLAKVPLHWGGFYPHSRGVFVLCRSSYPISPRAAACWPWVAALGAAPQHWPVCITQPGLMDSLTAW